MKTTSLIRQQGYNFSANNSIKASYYSGSHYFSSASNDGNYCMIRQLFISSLGFPANHGLDDSVDIVFGSHSETLDQSASISQPFLHYTTVAPVDDSQSDTSDSDGESELYQLDDSGYHKNKMAPVCIISVFIENKEILQWFCHHIINELAPI